MNSYLPIPGLPGITLASLALPARASVPVLPAITLARPGHLALRASACGASVLGLPMEST